jgi:4a-hydroxytetrahydrobiopterin dehydratase
MSELAQGKCVPCTGKEPSLASAEIEGLLPQVPGWQIENVDGIPHLTRIFKFKNFAQALDFANRVGAIAEEQDHHPAILVEYGRVTVSWWTHAVRGLHRNDFIMAAKTSQLIQE